MELAGSSELVRYAGESATAAPCFPTVVQIPVEVVSNCQHVTELKICHRILVNIPKKNKILENEENFQESCE